MKKIILFAIFLITFSGCSVQKTPLNTKNPTTITLWHNYGGVMQETMDILIDTFNATVGKDKGIIVKVAAVSSSSELTENLNMILQEDPAAMPMPNITICYPKVAVKLVNKDLLTDLTQYFTKEQIELYVDDFIKEGKINEGLYVFPVAKSTEVLFVNQTLFDRFSAATGVTIDSLSTFEGICDASIKYYEWCNKAFFVADSWFNLFSVMCEQTGESLIFNESIQTESNTYTKLYSKIQEAVEKGGISIYNGYSSDLSKTGDIVCSIGSTAGILYYGESVTYADNSSEKVEYTVLPYPTIDNGNKVAIQRGNGMVVKKATEAEEYASAIFLEWLTQPEQNMKFIRQTGYLPVTKQAYTTIVEGKFSNIDNVNIQKLLTTAVRMQSEYSFYIPPTYEEFDAQSKEFETSFKNKLGELAPSK